MRTLKLIALYLFIGSVMAVSLVGFVSADQLSDYNRQSVENWQRQAEQQAQQRQFQQMQEQQQQFEKHQQTEMLLRMQQQPTINPYVIRGLYQ